MAKLVLLQHGPKEDQWTEKTCAELIQAREALAGHELSVVLQHYDHDDTYARDAAMTYRNLGLQVTTVATPDLFYTGFFNIYRQVFTVSQALKQVEDDAIVMKLRNDQSVDFRKFLRRLEGFGFFTNPPDKLVTTNCFTRRDRHYHPSDMFVCSTGRFLKEYFSLPLARETHMDVQLRIIEMESHGLPQRKSMLFAPESHLFMHFLEERGWVFQYTDEDSLAALRKYCLLLNSWSIDFTWKKQRTPGIPAGGIILPHSDYTCTPFPGGPVEVANCYNENDIQGGDPTQEDISYMQMSRKAFRVFFDPNLLASIGFAPRT